VLKELSVVVREDAKTLGGLQREIRLVEELESLEASHQEAWRAEGTRKWKIPFGATPIALFTNESAEGHDPAATREMRSTDDIIFRVHCADHTYCTLRFPLAAPTSVIKRSAADKLGLKQDELLLVEVRSSGERLLIPESRSCVATGLSINGALFISPKEHLDALTPLPEQIGLDTVTSSASFLESVSSQELAYWITCIDWERFIRIHP
ncbi:unnamed protein product, partial [Cyprideis torosa]